MRKVTVRLRWSPSSQATVGQLAEANHRIYFEYDKTFLDRPLQLSPFKLPLQQGLIEHRDLSFGPLPGVFDDSLPDGWGLLLMNRALFAKGIDPNTISPLDRLSYVGSRAVGALIYEPPAELEPGPQPTIDLFMLGHNAQQVYDGQTLKILPQLLRAGGSPAGARPKALIGVRGDHIISGEAELPPGFEHWIVKFSGKKDARDSGPIEYAYAAMAAAAGIDLPQTRLFTLKRQSYFAARRFDRAPGNHRLHMHTFANLIHAGFRVPSTDYLQLAKLTLTLTENRADVLRLIRRMVFNIAAHNRDDHAKNFAFLMNHLGEWSLSPAYDLSYSNGPGGEHFMTVMGEGRAPTRQHILSLGTQLDIKPGVLREIIDQVNTAVGRWKHFADLAGCSKKAISAVKQRIHFL